MPHAIVTPIALLEARRRMAGPSKLATLRESLGRAPVFEPMRPFESRRQREERRERPAA